MKAPPTDSRGKRKLMLETGRALFFRDNLGVLHSAGPGRRDRGPGTAPRSWWSRVYFSIVSNSPTTSSIVQTWSATPAAIAGVLWMPPCAVGEAFAVRALNRNSGVAFVRHVTTRWSSYNRSAIGTCLSYHRASPTFEPPTNRTATPHRSISASGSSAANALIHARPRSRDR